MMRVTARARDDEGNPRQGEPERDQLAPVQRLRPADGGDHGDPRRIRIEKKAERRRVNPAEGGKTDAGDERLPDAARYKQARGPPPIHEQVAPRHREHHRCRDEIALFKACADRTAGQGPSTTASAEPSAKVDKKP